MKNIAIIPARGGSKRLPDKNIRMLTGLPLFVHSIIIAQENSDIIDDVFVSTDNSKIKEIALNYGAQVIDRPENLSGDFEPTASAIKHGLENLPESVENIFLLQPTNPLRPKNLISDAYKIFIESNSDSLMTVSRNKYKLGKLIDNKFLPFNYKPGQRSQDLSPLYFENGLLYISKSKTILDGKIISESVYPLITDHIYAQIDIDTIDDFEYAEYIIQKTQRKK